MKSRIFLPLFICSIASLALVSPAGAAGLKHSSKIIVAADGTRVQVTLTSSRTLSAKKKPSKVSVKAAGKTIKLKRLKAASAAKGYAATWQSGAYTGSFASKLQTLGGKRIKVTAKSRSGTTTKNSKVTVQNTTGGGGGGGPVFTPPASDLIGQAAWNHIGPYFLNSAFSDCAAGPWPSCAVEYRYVHCPNFSWRYMRTSGYGSSDINSHDSFTVTGVNANANGSWAVSYTSGTGGNYVWQGNTGNIVTGQYQYGPNPVENLGSFYWTRPAIAWDQLNGAC